MFHHAQKVVPDSLVLVDFAMRLVNSVLNLFVWQVTFFGEFKLHKYFEANLKFLINSCEAEAHFKFIWQSVLCKS